MQRYAFFLTCLLPIILNDTLHCRPVVDITEQTDLVKFNSGPGADPMWGLGAKPPEAERFFHFQKVIVALKLGMRPPSVEDFRGRPPAPCIHHWNQLL